MASCPRLPVLRFYRGRTIPLTFSPCYNRRMGNKKQTPFLERLLPSWEPAARYGLVAALALGGLCAAEVSTGHTEEVRAVVTGRDWTPGHNEDTTCTDDDGHQYVCGSHWVDDAFRVYATAESGEALRIDCKATQYDAAKEGEEVDVEVFVGGVLGTRTASFR